MDSATEVKGAAPVALLLAAGKGTRLGGLTANAPKCLLQLTDGATLLDKFLHNIAFAGIRRVVVVTGHARDALLGALEERDPSLEIQEVHVSEYERYNNFYSLYQGLKVLVGAALVVNSDVVISHEDVVRAARSVGSVLMVDESRIPDEEAMKVKHDIRGAARISKRLPSRGTHEYVGVMRLDSAGAAAYVKAAKGVVSDGVTDLYYEDVFDAMLGEGTIAFSTLATTSPWTEVDTVSDLEFARGLG